MMDRIATFARRLMLIGATAALLNLPVSSASVASAQSFPGPTPRLHTATSLLTNGGFESNEAPGTYTVAPGEPWVRAGAMVTTTLPRPNIDPYGAPHCGQYVLGTGGNWGGSGWAYQQVTIPSSDTAPVLDFYLLVHSNESGIDYFKGISNSLTVAVSSGTPNGTPNTSFVKTLATLTEWSVSAWNSWLHEGYYDMSAFSGQTIQLWFVSSIGSSTTTATNFYVDSVGLWTQTPGPYDYVC